MIDGNEWKEIYRSIGAKKLIADYDRGLLSKSELIGIIGYTNDWEISLKEIYPEFLIEVYRLKELESQGKTFIIFGGC